MASNTNTIMAAVERSLTSAISDAVFSKSNWETSIEIREIAAESITDLIESWSTFLGLHQDCSNPDDTVDKFHFVYTAAQKLNCYRNNTNALPCKIIACFTEQINGTPTPTIGLIKEILEAATKVQATQQRRIKAEQRDIARALAEAVAKQGKSAEAEDDEVLVGREQRTGKERKERLDGDDDMAAAGGAPTSDTSMPHSKIKMIAERNVAETMPPQEDEDADAQDANSKNTALTAAASSAPPPLEQTISPRQVKNPRPGPGNFNRESYTKWYPDEEAFMKAIIIANPTYTYQQYADANTARFKGTYYVDGDGRQHAGMREGRTANSVALRYRVSRQGILKAAREAERPSVAGKLPEVAELDSASAVAKTEEEVSKGGRAGGSSKNQGASTDVKDPHESNRTNWQAQGNSDLDDSSVGQQKTSGAGAGGPYTPNATGKSAPSEQADLPQPVRIYASGVALAPPSGKIADRTAYRPRSSGNEPGADTARDDSRGDEDPLGDLEDVMRGVEDGTL